MKLKNLIDWHTASLIKCSLCGLESPWNLASKKGWVIDKDAVENIYCPECKHFFINKLDDNKTIC